jgi:hypothetical protein
MNIQINQDRLPIGSLYLFFESIFFSKNLVNIQETEEDKTQFEKEYLFLLRMVQNPKNKSQHMDTIRNLISQFERKYDGKSVDELLIAYRNKIRQIEEKKGKKGIYATDTV